MGRGYRRKRQYTTSQRILIHLSSTPPTQPASLTQLTQDGIATAVASGRSTVTKWLDRLEGRGLVAGRRAHVPGYRVRRTVYELTSDGRREGEALRREVEGDVISVSDPRAGPISMKVAEVPRLLAPWTSLTAIVTAIHHGELELSNLSGYNQPRVGMEWGQGLRTPGQVFGREREFRELDAWVASPSTALVVTGLAGIGKSVLASAWALQRRPRARVFDYAPNSDSTPQSILANLGSFLSRFGRRALATGVPDERGSSPGAVAGVIGHELRGLACMILLDGFEKAPRDTARFIFGPFLEACRESGTKLLITTRYLPRGLPLAEDRHHHHVVVIDVKGLDQETSADLLRAHGLDADRAALSQIASAVRGHPLLLNLVAQAGSLPAGKIERYLETEVWAGLSSPERACLEAASVFRHSAPIHALKAMNGVTETAIARLQAKGLLEPTLSGAVAVHDIVAEFLRARIGEKRIRQLCQTAADYLMSSYESKDRVEGLYCLMRAGRMEEAASFLDAAGAPLLDSVAIQEVATLFPGIDLDALSPGAACVFAELRGDSLRISGRYGPALFQYRYAQRRSEQGGLEARLPRLLRKVGFIERCETRYKESLGHLIEAQARLTRAPNPTESAEVLKEMALVFQAQGDYSTAERYLNQAVDFAAESTEAGGLARSLLALASLEAEWGRAQRGLDYALEALRAADKSGNLTEAARAHMVAGTIQAALGHLDESLTSHERGLQLAKVLGNLRLIAYGAMNRAAALVDLGRPRDAMGPLEEAKQLFGILGERDTISILDVNEGIQLLGLGDAARAKRTWTRGLQALRESESRTDLIHGLREIAAALIRVGDPSQAVRYLMEANGEAERVKNRKLVEEISAEMKRLVPADSSRFRP